MKLGRAPTIQAMHFGSNDLCAMVPLSLRSGLKDPTLPLAGAPSPQGTIDNNLYINHVALTVIVDIAFATWR